MRKRNQIYFIVFYFFVWGLFFLKAEETKKENLSELIDLKYWSSDDYSRITIYLDKKSAYELNFLENPFRLYFDISDNNLTNKIPSEITINNSIIEKIRVNQSEKNITRIVIDLKTNVKYTTFEFMDPFRIVIDMESKDKKITEDLAEKDLLNVLDEKVSSKEKKITIVIDPGHGGKDPGTQGKRYKLKEKDVVLKLAKLLESKIKEKMDTNIILTRRNDINLSLEERTAIANRHNADLFVSIHLNSTGDKSVSGIQTFFLDLATDEASVKLAARENKISENSLLDFIKIDLIKTASGNESVQFAKLLHGEMVGYLSKHYATSKDMGVKPAMFYVLWGARMPSILIEAAFLSNPTEEKLLTNDNYLKFIANSIFFGISKWVKK